MSWTFSERLMYIIYVLCPEKWAKNHWKIITFSSVWLVYTFRLQDHSDFKD